MLGLLQVLSDDVEAFERMESDQESNKMKLSTAPGALLWDQDKYNGYSAHRVSRTCCRLEERSSVETGSICCFILGQKTNEYFEVAEQADCHI